MAGVRRIHRHELTRNFVRRLIEQASSAAGVLRVTLNREFGADRNWMPLLKELAVELGYTATREHEGKYTRFYLIR